MNQSEVGWCWCLLLCNVDTLPIDHEVWQGYVAHLPRPDGEWLALGALEHCVLGEDHLDPLGELQRWLDRRTGIAFGVVSYDLRGHIEPTLGAHPDPAAPPVLAFFRPRTLLFRESGSWQVVHNHSPWPDDQLVHLAGKSARPLAMKRIALHPSISRERYLSDVGQLLEHIRIGDIYEVNYCQTFTADALPEDPYALWRELCRQTEAPMAGYFSIPGYALLCASPERYLQRHANTVRSQPIKGTIRRGSTPAEDAGLSEKLRNDPKEQSENIMIVDLVRNDLSRSALPGTVCVEELFGIHTFRTVHHMVSTIRAEVPAATLFTQLLRDTFPMGSMTGAPKISAMRLADRHEALRRGWYSGSLGWIDDHGNFEFNVIIRSLCLDERRGVMTCSVGSAITIQADAAREYDECLLKLEAIRCVLAG